MDNAENSTETQNPEIGMFSTLFTGLLNSFSKRFGFEYVFGLLFKKYELN